jgi:hypothetical protein
MSTSSGRYIQDDLSQASIIAGIIPPSFPVNSTAPDLHQFVNSPNGQMFVSSGSAVASAAPDGATSTSLDLGAIDPTMALQQFSMAGAIPGQDSMVSGSINSGDLMQILAGGLMEMQADDLAPLGFSDGQMGIMFQQYASDDVCSNNPSSTAGQ